MSLVAFYKHLGKGKFKEITSEEVKALKEISATSAIVTVDRRMFINNYNTAFSFTEIKKILDFAQSLKKKEDENKYTNSNSTSGV
jgi:hypothetical protein